MNFEEAGIKFVELKKQLHQGLITPQVFEAQVANLVVVSSDGVTWKLEPNTGTWLKVDTGQVVKPTKTKKEIKPPETLFQLGALIFKTLMSNLPKTIFLGLLMAVLTWGYHTYLVAVVNNGLMYNSAKHALNAVVNWQQANFPGVEAFWGLLSYFVSNSVARLFGSGIINWAKGFVMLPAWIIQAFMSLKRKSIYFLLFGIAAALLTSYLIKNFMVSWILAFGLLLTLTAQFQSTETLVLRLTLSDLQRLFRLRLLSPELQNQGIYLLLLGLSAGFALAGIWKTRLNFTFISFWVFLILFIASLFLLRRKEIKQMILFLLVTTGGVFLYYLPALAVCQGGNLSATGGNWLQWWGYRGAEVVRGMGLAPAGSSLLGSLLGSSSGLISSIVGAFTGKPVILPAGAPQVKTTTPIDQAKIDRINKINEEARKLKAEADQAGSIWGLIKQTLSNSKNEVADTAKSAGKMAVKVAKSAVNTVKEGVKGAYEGARKVYNNPSIITDGLKSGLNKVKEAVRGAGAQAIGIVKDIYNNPSIITDTLKGMGKDAIGLVKTIGTTTKNVAVGVGKAIYKTVTDPKKMWGLVKDTLKESVGWNNFKNSLDPNRSLGSRIGQTLIGTAKLGFTLATLGVGAKAQAAKTAVGAVGKTAVAANKATAIRSGATLGIKTTAGKSVTTAAGSTAKVVSPASKKAIQNFQNGAVKAVKGPFTKAPHAKLTGLSQKEVTTIQQGLNKFGLEATVRPPTFEGARWIGKGVAKPEAIKNKTLGFLDNLLGAKGQPGLIGSYKPDKNLTRNLINNIKSNPGIPPARKQQMIREVMDTFKQRSREFIQNRSNLDDLAKQGKIFIKNGAIFDAKSGKPFIPDVDFFNFTKAGGGKADPQTVQKFFNYLKSKGVRTGGHGAHLDWVPKDQKGINLFNKIVKNHGQGGEALIGMGPGGYTGGQYYTP